MVISRSVIVTVVVLLSILILAGSAMFYVYTNNKQEQIESSQAGVVLKGDSATSYQDIDGNPISLEQYLGSVIIAFSWASWCPQCADQIKMLSEVADRNPNVVILAFNRAEPRTTVAAYLEYSKLNSSVSLVVDSTDHFYTSIGGYAMPETVIFDTEGEIFQHIRGVSSRTSIESYLQALQSS